MAIQSKHRGASVVVLGSVVACLTGAYGPSFVFGGAPRIGALPHNIRDSVAAKLPEMPASEPSSSNVEENSSAAWLSTVAALVSTAAACGLVIGLGSSSPAEAVEHPEYRFLVPMPKAEPMTFANPEKSLEEAKVGLAKAEVTEKTETDMAKSKAESAVKQIAAQKKGEASAADAMKGDAKDKAYRALEGKYRDMLEKVALARDTESEAAVEKWRAERGVLTDTIKQAQGAIDTKRQFDQIANDLMLSEASADREEAELAARQKEKATIMMIAEAGKKEGVKIENIRETGARQAAEEAERNKKTAGIENAKATRLAEEEAARAAEVKVRLSRKM